MGSSAVSFGYDRTYPTPIYVPSRCPFETLQEVSTISTSIGQTISISASGYSDGKERIVITYNKLSNSPPNPRGYIWSRDPYLDTHGRASVASKSISNVAGNPKWNKACKVIERDACKEAAGQVPPLQG